MDFMSSGQAIPEVEEPPKELLQFLSCALAEGGSNYRETTEALDGFVADALSYGLGSYAVSLSGTSSTGTFLFRWSLGRSGGEAVNKAFGSPRLLGIRLGMAGTRQLTSMAFASGLGANLFIAAGVEISFSLGVLGGSLATGVGRCM